MTVKTYAVMDDLVKEHPELELLSELSHEISNFRPGFKGKVDHTFILTPWASSLFGFEIERGKAYIGVPAMIFDILIRTRLYLINYIPKKPGIFIVFDLGKGESRRPVSIRVHMRTKRVESLSKFSSVNIIKMDEKGIATPGYDEDEFPLFLRPVEALDWEKYNAK